MRVVLIAIGCLLLAGCESDEKKLPRLQLEVYLANGAAYGDSVATYKAWVANVVAGTDSKGDMYSGPAFDKWRASIVRRDLAVRDLNMFTYGR